MPVISIFSAAFCRGEEVAKKTAERLGFPEIEPRLLEAAAKNYDVPEAKLRRAMLGPPFIFDKFTRTRARLLACLKVETAELLKAGDGVLSGFAGHLIPRKIGTVLRVCLVADGEHRAALMTADGKTSAAQARRLIAESDAERVQWTDHLFKLSPWDKSLYDLKIPLHSTTVDKAVDLICESAAHEALFVGDNSARAVADFGVAARVELALIEAGRPHRVSCAGGAVTVTVDEYVLRLETLEETIKKICLSVPGVKSAEVITGPDYRPASMFAAVEVEMPEKILLVDDERDFVLTLSERLRLRDMESAVAYDGERALEILKDEEPDVIVLDLKMPGIDGIEVLRKVKAEHPEVQVIVLTGHGGEQDRRLCMELGAFAYLEKPVDIEALSQTMREAYEKVKSNRK